MFTIADLRSIAVQIERNGEATYRRAGDQTRDPRLKDLLFWMAEEEKKHRQWFERLSMASQAACEMVELENLGQALLSDMMKRQKFSLDERQLGTTGSLEEVLAQSKEFEEDTILFYELLHDFLDDPEAVRHLELIIAEEREHVRRLDAALSQKNDGA